MLRWMRKRSKFIAILIKTLIQSQAITLDTYASTCELSVFMIDQFKVTFVAFIAYWLVLANLTLFINIIITKY